jgi:hypothetical protein
VSKSNHIASVQAVAEIFPEIGRDLYEKLKQAALTFVQRYRPARPHRRAFHISKSRMIAGGLHVFPAYPDGFLFQLCLPASMPGTALPVLC